jgi:uroporphyrinogen-III synthase
MRSLSLSRPVVLIVRPKEQAEDFAVKVFALGAEPLVCPIQDVETLVPEILLLPEVLSPQGIHGIVVTSSNAFAAKSRGGDVPIFAIGSATATAAREAGNTQVYEADGHFENLLRLIRAHTPAGGGLLYLRGENVRHDMVASLPEYRIVERAVYRTQDAQKLPQPAVEAFQAGRISAIAVFSPHSAELLKKLLIREGYEGEVRRINLLSLSGAVLESIQDLPWSSVRVAKTPSASALLDQLCDLVQGTS